MFQGEMILTMRDKLIQVVYVAAGSFQTSSGNNVA